MAETYRRIAPSVDSNISGAPRWYVAQTLARRELSAVGQLERQGFKVFLPKFVKTVRHARKMRTVCVAVFPGYLFVSLDLARDRWRSVNSTINVARLVMGDNAPLPVPVGVVEGLIAYRDASGVCRLECDLQPGQAVRIVEGPFAAVLGRIAALDDRGRARVLLEIMGGGVITTLERSALERA